MSIESMMSSNNLILCCSFSSCSQSFPPSRVFNELSLHIRWPKGWHFCFSFSSSSDYSGLISFRIDWFDFIAVQGTLKSLLQYHSLKTLIVRSSAFFMVWFSHQYMTTGKKHGFDYIDFCWWTDVSTIKYTAKIVIAFLPRSNHLLISWLKSPSRVALETRKIKSVAVSILSQFISHEMIRLDLHFLNVEWKKQLFHSPLPPLSRGPFIPLHFLP